MGKIPLEKKKVHPSHEGQCSWDLPCSLVQEAVRRQIQWRAGLFESYSPASKHCPRPQSLKKHTGISAFLVLESGLLKIRIFFILPTVPFCLMHIGQRDRGIKGRINTPPLPPDTTSYYYCYYQNYCCLTTSWDLLGIFYLLDLILWIRIY